MLFVTDHPNSTYPRFYQGYVTFFSKHVSEKGAASTLEEFVFSEKYNFQKGRDENTQPGMLSRLFEGLAHPLIHVGYGVEFGLKGMLVEGTSCDMPVPYMDGSTQSDC